MRGTALSVLDGQNKGHVMDPVLALWAGVFCLVLIAMGVLRMSNATDRLDAAVARIAKDVGDAVERIRSNTSAGDTAAVLADCDKLDGLSTALEGLGDHVSGTEAGAVQVPSAEQPQG